MMGRFLNFKLPRRSRKKTWLVLALIWCLGLVPGLAVGIKAGEPFWCVLREAPYGVASVMGLIGAMMFPMVLSALVLWLEQTWCLYLLAFAKAFLLACTGAGIVMAYGSAGWLVRMLLMFSDCCAAPLLLLFWASQLMGDHHRWIGTIPATLLVGCFDYYMVSPFLAALLS